MSALLEAVGWVAIALFYVGIGVTLGSVLRLVARHYRVSVSPERQEGER